MPIKTVPAVLPLRMVGLACAAFALALTPAVEAAPRGPSARAAARLKKYPPNNWIKHYLPDDRYKVAGNVWRYVTTDVDSYYHRPDSPRMLQQSPNQVIGFASAKDAEEAGYEPDPADGIGAGGGLTAGFSTSITSTTSSAPVRLTLTDGTSTLVLPAGWSRLLSMQQKKNNASLSLDMLQSPQRERVAVVKLLDPGMIVEPFLTPRYFNQMKSGNSFSQFSNVSGIVNSNLSHKVGDSQKLFSNFTASSAHFAGMSGVVINMKSRRSPVTGQMTPSKTYIVGRGSTLIFVADLSRSGRVALPLLRTLRVR